MGKEKDIRFITRERFYKAKASGNYGDILPEAEKIIKNAHNLDVLKLSIEEGSAFKVLSAEKIDEATFMRILKQT